MIINPDDHYEQWVFSTVLDEFAKEVGVAKNKLKRHFGDAYQEQLLEYVIKNSDKIIRFAALDDDSISTEALEYKKLSKLNPDKIIYLKRDNGNDYYLLNGNVILFYKDRLRWIGESLVPVELISDIWDDVLPNDLHNEGGVNLRKGKKPEKLINRIFESTTLPGEIILDYFAGSATSAAVALKAKRKFINIEAGEYFRALPLKRLKNTLYGDKSGVTKLYNWKGGGMFKYIKLESYEDALNNIELKRTSAQQSIIDNNPALKEQYMIFYMLDKEAAGSPSLLNIDMFSDPFNYRMKIADGLETKAMAVDLVETFNYLIGLTVKKINAREYFNIEPDSSAGYEGAVKLIRQKSGPYCFKTVEGVLRGGEKVLVIWRVLTGNPQNDNAALDAYLKEQRISTQDFEYDLIYINGDNNLQNMKLDEEHWKVVLTEEEFNKRMFDIKDI